MEYLPTPKPPPQPEPTQAPSPMPPPPPPPELPKAPRNRKAKPTQAQPTQATQPEAPPPSTVRELAKDPMLREGQRASVRSAAETVLGLFSLAGAQFPPNRPLSQEEQAMIRPPLEDTLYKYGGEVDPAVALALAVLAVAGMRFVEFKTMQAASGEKRPEEVKVA